MPLIKAWEWHGSGICRRGTAVQEAGRHGRQACRAGVELICALQLLLAGRWQVAGQDVRESPSHEVMV